MTPNEAVARAFAMTMKSLAFPPACWRCRQGAGTRLELFALSHRCAASRPIRKSFSHRALRIDAAGMRPAGTALAIERCTQ
jgi:hypothetical protein